MSVDQEASRGTTRQQIPEVALKLFADKGYQATSMREIAEQLGMTKAALYYHFDSKEAIVRELFAGMHQQVVDLVAWAKQQEQNPTLPAEVLTRWTNIMHAHGLALFRFLVADGHVFQEARPDRLGMRELLQELDIALIPEGATVKNQLRVRLALMSINMAGIVGAGLNATDEQILEASHDIAVEVLAGLRANPDCEESRPQRENAT